MQQCCQVGNIELGPSGVHTSAVKYGMVSIPLSSTYRCKNSGLYLAIVDECDSDLASLSWFANIKRRGVNTLVYAARTIENNKTVLMHRIVAERAFGPIPIGMEVDHIRHGESGGLDNRRSNLRIVPHALNVANGRTRINNTSGYKGVHFVERIGRWQALIRVNGARKHLGYFDSILDAAAAYEAEASRAWRDSANPNGVPA